jgi:glycosyltransferase involved in cell wall biosynthesis
VPPPLVSTIIPCYNAERWLAAAIDSALAQTHSRQEIIVVDDGSSDHSLAIAKPYARRGVQICVQSNRGAACARNHGLAVARGEYVQFLDADDLLAPDKIALQLARLAMAPAGSIASSEWARFTNARTGVARHDRAGFPPAALRRTLDDATDRLAFASNAPRPGRPLAGRPVVE